MVARTLAGMDVTVRPERLVAGGSALAREHDEETARDGDDGPDDGRRRAGRVVFVDGALPGELVRVRLTSSRKDHARGVVVEVLERSPDRDSPSCAHRRAGCGGCDWMHVAPHLQSEAKVGIVRESLRRIGRLPPDVVDELVVTGGSVSPFGYRTTIRVVGGPGGAVGYREQGSDRVVPVSGCPVAESRLSRLLPALRLDEGVELTLRTSVATGALTAVWDRTRRRSVRGLPPEVHIGDRAWLTERVAGRDLRVSASSFFQSGPQAAELLVDAVSRAAPELQGCGHAVDAYGGVGLFAATVMASAQHVTLVESSTAACRDAEHNLADRLHVDPPTASVVRSEVGRWTAPSGSGGRPIDVIVADPARPGLGRPGRDALTAPGAPVLVLVSCDPASLARDLTLLGETGYVADRVEVLDLFPHTHHVETVTRVVRRGGSTIPRDESSGRARCNVETT